MSTEEDERAVVRGLRLMHKIVSAPAMAPLVEGNLVPAEELVS
jgi:hypothetical protein